MDRLRRQHYQITSDLGRGRSVASCRGQHDDPVARALLSDARRRASRLWDEWHRAALDVLRGGRVRDAATADELPLVDAAIDGGDREADALWAYLRGQGLPGPWGKPRDDLAEWARLLAWMRTQDFDPLASPPWWRP